MKSITIATYNIRHGHDVGLDFIRLADVIRSTKADLVGLQEVDMLTRRVKGKDTLCELAAATELPYAYFTSAMDYDGGRYGTAILSKYPLEFSETFELYSGGYEPRSVGVVELTLPDGTPLRLVNTHLCVESVEARAIQIKQIAYRCGELLKSDVPTVITGDFNTDDLAELEPFAEYGFETVNGTTTVYPTFRPDGAAIDHILYRRDQWKLDSCEMISSDTSDHNPLVCRLSILT